MSAMTDNRQQVYVSDGYSEPMSAQHNFANNFDLNDPEQAMTAYQRYVRPNTNPTHRAVTNLSQNHARTHQASAYHRHRLGSSKERCLVIIIVI